MDLASSGVDYRLVKFNPFLEKKGSKINLENQSVKYSLKVTSHSTAGLTQMILAKFKSNNRVRTPVE
jgi:hypothetical protein